MKYHFAIYRDGVLYIRWYDDLEAAVAGKKAVVDGGEIPDGIDAESPIGALKNCDVKYVRTEK